MLARPLENRRVVALNHRDGESLFRRGHPAARPEELRNRSIATLCPHLPRHRVETLPEIVLRAESGRARLEMGIGEAIDQKTRLAGDVEDLVAPAVNELRAELDRKRPAAHASREDPAAHPRAGLENGDGEPGRREPLRGGEPRRAGADDEDIERAFGHLNLRLSKASASAPLECAGWKPSSSSVSRARARPRSTKSASSTRTCG